jgi:hypothetical protein
VYRDPGAPAPSSSSRRSAADDSAYWYDLLAEDPVQQHEEARGPFEPLLPSAEAEAGTEQPQGPQEPPDAARAERQEPPEQARARKLEQLKDLYLTAEAIGEQNVDKHFDQLLAQQRELISDYFRQSPAAQSPAAQSPAAQPPAAQPGAVQPGVTSPRDGQAADAEPEHRQPDGPVTPPEGVSVRAEPPRAW